VTVAITSEGAASAEYRLFLEPLSKQVTIDPSLTLYRALTLKNAFRRAALFDATVRRHKPDHVLVPSADGLAQISGLRHALHVAQAPRAPVEAALHRGSFAYRPSSARARAVAAFSRRALEAVRWERLFQVDVLAYEWIGRHAPRLARKSEVLPDPIVVPVARDPAEAREQFGLEKNRFVVGCVGTMTRRKGIDLLIRAFAAAAPRVPEAQLFLLGVFDPDVAAVLSEVRDLVEKKRIVALDRYASNDELDAALAAMDVVCTPYPHHVGIASILLRAIAAGKPLLSADYGWSGFMTRTFDLGTTVDVSNPEAFAGAIAEAPGRFGGRGAPEAAERLLRFHSVENFQNVWTRELRRRLGLAVRPALSWQEVMAAGPLQQRDSAVRERL
jgi:glycosyltransferase involved in cell wall biosynthesis